LRRQFRDPILRNTAICRNRNMQQHDPLAVIETETPKFSDADAIAIAHEHYGLEASVRSLVSERDQNFHLRIADGREFVLKIANALEDPEVTEFQILALLHLEEWRRRSSFGLNAPRILRSKNGATHFELKSRAGSHVARVVTFVAGVPLADRLPSTRLSSNMGRYLAHLGRALRDFAAPGSSQALLWDMQRAPDIRRLLPCFSSESNRRLVEKTLHEFEQTALPQFAQLRQQVIHSDFNPDNVLVEFHDENEVAGVIDFGDMLRSPLIVDVAIGACYLRPEEGNPLSLMAEFVAAYHTVTSLTQAEIGVLFILIKTRLAVSMAILYWRMSSRERSDPYLAKLLSAESTAENFLRRLDEVPCDHAAQTFRQVCASARIMDA
jgi:Ser/Thr protein kinase RdoA (MazF antagonist)